MVRFQDPEIVEKVDKSYIDIRRGYWGAAPGIRETRRCSLRTPRLPRLLMEEHLRDHWIGGWLKEPFCLWSSPLWGSWSPWLQTEGGGEDEEEHSELIPSSRLLERHVVRSVDVVNV